MFNRTTRIVLVSVVLTMALLFSAVSVFHVLNDTTDQVSKNTSLAEQNAKEVRQIKAVLFSEKVCSDTNRGQACRDLFNRLASSLSPDQRFRLGCDVLAALNLAELDTLRRQAKCPPPLASSK
jgi:hypothetical protein